MLKDQPIFEGAPKEIKSPLTATMAPPKQPTKPTPTQTTFDEVDGVPVINVPV